MAQPFPIRRAAIYRHRANDIEQRQLPDTRDAVDRKHLLNLAETYRRTPPMQWRATRTRRTQGVQSQ